MSIVLQVPRYGACELREPARSAANGHTGRQRPQAGAHGNDKSLEAAAENALGRDSRQRLEEDLLHRLARRIPCLGIMLALCASFFLGSAGMLVKMTHSVHGIQVAVFRAMIQVLVYGSVIVIRRLPCTPTRRELAPVMGRALLGATSITCSYCALKMIPLGDATTIRFSLPIWTLIISYIVLNESCSPFKVGAVVVSIMGVVLIAKPDDCVYLAHKLLRALNLESTKDFGVHWMEFEASKAIEWSEETREEPSMAEAAHEPMRQLEGSLLALASSICLSLSLVALRLCKRTPAEITILWLSIISILIGCVTLLLLDELRLPDNWLDVLFIGLNGLCGSVGQWFITSALKVEQSGVISLTRTADIEVAFLYSAFLLREHIRITSIVGSVLVSLGVIAVVVPKWLGANNADSQSLEEASREEEEEVDGGEENSEQRQRRGKLDQSDEDDTGPNEMIVGRHQVRRRHASEGCLARYEPEQGKVNQLPLAAALENKWQAAPRKKR